MLQCGNRRKHDCLIFISTCRLNVAENTVGRLQTYFTAGEKKKSYVCARHEGIIAHILHIGTRWGKWSASCPDRFNAGDGMKPHGTSE